MSDLQPLPVDTLPAPPEALAQDALAHTVGQGPEYRRLSISDIGLILALHDEGKTQVEIAQRLGKHQSAISRCLKKLTGDSASVAQALLKARAYRSAVRVARIAEKSQDEGEALKAAKFVLQANGIGVDRASQVSVGVQVVLGYEGVPPKAVSATPSAG
jgi:predicted transcriptional regulator